jgi:hypothetical protein
VVVAPQNADGIPDALEDGTLSSAEILANPQAQVFLNNMAASIGQQQGIQGGASVVRVPSSVLSTTVIVDDSEIEIPRLLVNPFLLYYVTGLRVRVAIDGV